jgi:hypothetical protein
MSITSQRKAELNAATAGIIEIPSASAPVLSGYVEKKKLAEELGLNERTLDRWDVLRMGPPRTHVGRKVLYRRISVQKWLAAQERQGRAS